MLVVKWVEVQRLKEIAHRNPRHVVVAYKSMPVNQLHLIEEVQEVEVTKPVQVDCRFEQVFVERSIVIINGEQFNLNKDEDSLLQPLKDVDTPMPHQPICSGKTVVKTLLWTYTVVGVVHVALGGHFCQQQPHHV